MACNLHTSRIHTSCHLALRKGHISIILASHTLHTHRWTAQLQESCLFLMEMFSSVWWTEPGGFDCPWFSPCDKFLAQILNRSETLARKVDVLTVNLFFFSSRARVALAVPCEKKVQFLCCVIVSCGADGVSTIFYGLALWRYPRIKLVSWRPFRKSPYRFGNTDLWLSFAPTSLVSHHFPSL